MFTPNDSALDWLAAKIYFRSAEGDAQIATHAVRTHFSLEPVIMAAMHNLASTHPLYKLLRRHFRYTLAINEGARQTLLADGGVFDEFIATGGPDKGYLRARHARAWKQWRSRIKNASPTTSACAAWTSPYALPYYPYRDDAMPLWNAISTYAQGILSLAWRNDDNVAADPELQAFCARPYRERHPRRPLPLRRPHPPRQRRRPRAHVHLHGERRALVGEQPPVRALRLGAQRAPRNAPSAAPARGRARAGQRRPHDALPSRRA